MSENFRTNLAAKLSISFSQPKFMSKMLKFQASKTFLSTKFSNTWDLFIGCSLFAREAYIECLMIILWKSAKLDPGKSRLLFWRMWTKLNFICISYSCVRTKTPLNTSLYVVQNFEIIFNWKKISEKHNFSSFWAIFGKNCRKIFSFKFTYLSIP